MENKYREAWEFLNNVISSTDIDRIMPLKDLVDKETPMKPIDINGGKYCGRCKQGLIIVSFRLNSCHNLDCRQVVDWSDEE